MAIDFYFDFSSPYGFIAAMQVQKFHRPVRWRPFLLGAIYKVVGQSPLEHPLKREYVLKVDAPRQARQIGLELKAPKGFTEHSLQPSRAFPARPRYGYHVCQDVYRKYWLQGHSTIDIEVVAASAASMGFERQTLLSGLQSDKAKARLAFENEQALQRGVFGSPFFIVDGEPFWGSDQISLIGARG